MAWNSEFEFSFMKHAVIFKFVPYDTMKLHESNTVCYKRKECTSQYFQYFDCVYLFYRRGAVFVAHREEDQGPKLWSNSQHELYNRSNSHNPISSVLRSNVNSY